MITEGDTSNIVYHICEQLQIETLQGANARNYSRNLRVVVHAHKQEREKQYLKNFIEVNVIAEDIGNEAQTSLLKEYERRLQAMFYEDLVGEYEGNGYIIELKTLGMEEDATLKSHFINCKLLFSTLR